MDMWTSPLDLPTSPHRPPALTTRGRLRPDALRLPHVLSKALEHQTARAAASRSPNRHWLNITSCALLLVPGHEETAVGDALAQLTRHIKPRALLCVALATCGRLDTRRRVWGAHWLCDAVISRSCVGQPRNPRLMVGNPLFTRELDGTATTNRSSSTKRSRLDLDNWRRGRVT